MKLNHLHAACLAVAVQLFFVACLTTQGTDKLGSPEKKPDGKSVKELKIMSGELWDVNTGENIGVYEYKKAGGIFSLYMQADKTRSDSSLTGATVFAPCEGVFEGSVARAQDGFLITGSDENGNYHIIVHELPQNQLSAPFNSSERGKNVYLLSVMDKAVFEEVFLDEGSDPRAALRVLTPFLRTHAIITQ